METFTVTFPQHLHEKARQVMLTAMESKGHSHVRFAKDSATIHSEAGDDVVLNLKTNGTDILKVEVEANPKKIPVADIKKNLEASLAALKGKL